MSTDWHALDQLTLECYADRLSAAAGEEGVVVAPTVAEPVPPSSEGETGHEHGIEL